MPLIECAGKTFQDVGKIHTDAVVFGSRKTTHMFFGYHDVVGANENSVLTILVDGDEVSAAGVDKIKQLLKEE